MVLKIVALCLSCFALGWSCCSIVYQIMMLRDESRKNRRKE